MCAWLMATRASNGFDLALSESLFTVMIMIGKGIDAFLSVFHTQRWRLAGEPACFGYTDTSGAAAGYVG